MFTGICISKAVNAARGKIAATFVALSVLDLFFIYKEVQRYFRLLYLLPILLSIHISLIFHKNEYIMATIILVLFLTN